jgi:ankyrin repeat protein
MQPFTNAHRTLNFSNSTSADDAKAASSVSSVPHSVTNGSSPIASSSSSSASAAASSSPSSPSSSSSSSSSVSSASSPHSFSLGDELGSMRDSIMSLLREYFEKQTDEKNTDDRSVQFIDLNKAASVNFNNVFHNDEVYCQVNDSIKMVLLMHCTVTDRFEPLGRVIAECEQPYLLDDSLLLFVLDFLIIEQDLLSFKMVLDHVKNYLGTIFHHLASISKILLHRSIHGGIEFVNTLVSSSDVFSLDSYGNWLLEEALLLNKADVALYLLDNMFPDGKKIDTEDICDGSSWLNLAFSMKCTERTAAKKVDIINRLINMNACITAESIEHAIEARVDLEELRNDRLCDFIGENAPFVHPHHGSLFELCLGLNQINNAMLLKPKSGDKEIWVRTFKPLVQNIPVSTVTILKLVKGDEIVLHHCMHACFLFNLTPESFDFVFGLFETDINELSPFDRPWFHHILLHSDLPLIKHVMDKYKPNVMKVDSRYNSCVHMAAARGDIDVLRYIISACGNAIGDTNQNDASALHAFCGSDSKTKQLKCVDILVREYGLDRNKVDKKDFTPFMYCLQVGDTNTAQYLVEVFNVNTRAFGLNGGALHAACKHGDITTLNFALGYVPENKREDELIRYNGYGGAPMHVATFYNHTELVEYMISTLGVDPNILTNQNHNQPDGSIACIAACCGHVDMIHMLARLSIPLHSDDWDEQPIEYAAKNNRFECVGVLLEYVDAVEGVNLQELLHYAISNSHVETMMVLLKGGVQPSIGILKQLRCGSKCMRPLLQNWSQIRDCNVQAIDAFISALKRGCYLCYRTLADYIKVPQADLNSFKFLVHARNPELFKLVCESGADMNQYVKYRGEKMKIVTYHLFRDNRRIVRYAFEHGFDFTAQMPNGDYPIHRLAYMGLVGVLRQLYRCDPSILNAVDNRGHTVFHHVCMSESYQKGACLKFLIDNAGDELLYKPSFSGEFPLGTLIKQKADIELLMMMFEASNKYLTSAPAVVYDFLMLAVRSDNEPAATYLYCTLPQDFYRQCRWSVYHEIAKQHTQIRDDSWMLQYRFDGSCMDAVHPYAVAACYGATKMVRCCPIENTDGDHSEFILSALDHGHAQTAAAFVARHKPNPGVHDNLLLEAVKYVQSLQESKESINLVDLIIEKDPDMIYANYCDSEHRNFVQLALEQGISHETVLYWIGKYPPQQQAQIVDVADINGVHLLHPLEHNQSPLKNSIMNLLSVSERTVRASKRGHKTDNVSLRAMHNIHNDLFIALDLDKSIEDDYLALHIVLGELSEKIQSFQAQSKEACKRLVDQNDIGSYENIRGILYADMVQFINAVPQVQCLIRVHERITGILTCFSENFGIEVKASRVNTVLDFEALGTTYAELFRVYDTWYTRVLGSNCPCGSLSETCVIRRYMLRSPVFKKLRVLAYLAQPLHDFVTRVQDMQTQCERLLKHMNNFEDFDKTLAYYSQQHPRCIHEIALMCSRVSVHVLAQCKSRSDYFSRRLWEAYCTRGVQVETKSDQPMERYATMLFEELCVERFAFLLKTLTPHPFICPVDYVENVYDNFYDQYHIDLYTSTGKNIMADVVNDIQSPRILQQWLIGMQHLRSHGYTVTSPTDISSFHVTTHGNLAVTTSSITPMDDDELSITDLFAQFATNLFWALPEIAREPSFLSFMCVATTAVPPPTVGTLLRHPYLSQYVNNMQLELKDNAQKIKELEGNEQQCIICDETFPSNIGGIICNSNHAMCNTCFVSQVRASSDLSDFKSNGGKVACAYCIRSSECPQPFYAQADVAACCSRTSEGKETYEKLLEIQKQLAVNLALQGEKEKHEQLLCNERERWMDHISNGTMNDMVVDMHVNHIEKKIYPTRCPGCNTNFEDFDACFALQCPFRSCRVHFCGWCFKQSANSTENHNHVRSCQNNVSRNVIDNVYGESGSFEAFQNRRRRVEIRAYLHSIKDRSIQKAVCSRIWKMLTKVGLYSMINTDTVMTPADAASSSSAASASSSSAAS